MGRSELDQADLGDVRRNRRLVQIVENLAASPEPSVPLPSRDRLCVNRIFLHTHFDRSNCCTVVVLANLRFNFSGLIRAVATFFPRLL